MSGYLARQPGWRRRRRSAQNHGDVVLVQYVDGAAQPGKIKLALRRLHQRPGEFGDAHVGEAEIGHHARVFFPKRFRRLVGIVVNPEQKRPSCGSAGKTRDRLGPQGKPDTGRAHQGKSAAEKLTPGRRCQSQDLSMLVNAHILDSTQRPVKKESEGCLCGTCRVARALSSA